MKLLLVEDDTDLGTVLLHYLKSKDFQVTLARSAEEALKMYHADNVELCILDIMLPGMDGLQLAQKIKSRNPETPIIFLTAKSEKKDILKGLTLGADDYICKPFDPEELVLRVHNIMRRVLKVNTKTEVIGNLSFHLDLMEIRYPDQVFKLTLKEAELMQYFLQNKNRVVKREEILVKLWGENDYFLGRSLDVFISRLRKYLQKEKSVSLDTLRKVGFILRTKQAQRDKQPLS